MPPSGTEQAKQKFNEGIAKTREAADRTSILAPNSSDNTN